MRRFLVPALTALTLAGSGLALAAAPASAAYATSLGPLSTATTGHVTGTVTTDAPYVRVSVRDDAWGFETDSHTVAAHAGGDVAFDLETWGVGNGTVIVEACQAAETACDAWVTSDFVASDAAPTLAWPEDVTIGGTQEYAVTVTDANGGGILRAVWEHDYWQDLQTLSADAPTPLALQGNGQGAVRVFRCHEVGINVCRDTGVTREITVRRSIGSSVSLPQTEGGWAISPAAGTELDAVITPSVSGEYTFDWAVTRSSDGAATGVGGQETGLATDAEGRLHAFLDVTGLGNGLYTLEGTLTNTDDAFVAEFGTVSGATYEVGFNVDVTGPTVTGLTRSRTTVYPYRDNYQDTVGLTVRTTGYQYYDTVQVKVQRNLDADPELETVRTLATTSSDDVNHRATWSGRRGDGSSAPAGTYTLVGVAFDKAGNRHELAQGTITVVRKRLSALRTYKRTASATGTLEAQQVGRCSTLRKPSLRGWAGSMGLYTNTRCRRTFEDSLVLTIHAMQMPRAARYGDLRVAAYGGAAKAAPRSLAYLAYINRQDDLVASTQMSTRLTTHNGALRPGANFVFDDRYVVWSTYTAEGARYDIKNFTVTLKYQVLVAE